MTGLVLCGVGVEFLGDLDAGDDKLVLVPSIVTVVCDSVRVVICAFSTSFSSRSSMFSLLACAPLSWKLQQ